MSRKAEVKLQFAIDVLRDHFHGWHVKGFNVELLTGIAAVELRDSEENRRIARSRHLASAQMIQTDRRARMFRQQILCAHGTKDPVSKPPFGHGTQCFAYLPQPIGWAHLRRDFQAMIDRRNAGSRRVVRPRAGSSADSSSRCITARGTVAGPTTPAAPRNPRPTSTRVLTARWPVSVRQSAVHTMPLGWAKQSLRRLRPVPFRRSGTT